MEDQCPGRMTVMQTSTQMSRCERQYRADEASQEPDFTFRGSFMLTGQPSAFAGIDWGNSTHEVCLILPGKTEPLRHAFPHSPDGLRDLAAWLLRHSNVDTLGIAIEVPHGPVVEAVQDVGFAVFAINPKQLDRFRDRHSVAGAKDDRRDAFVLATSLKTDIDRFTQVPEPDALTTEMRATSRLYDSLTHDLVDHANRLWDTVNRSAPHLLTLCKGADQPWFWDLCDRFFSKGAPRRDWVQRLLKRYRKRLTADAVLEVLRTPGLVLPASRAVAPLQTAALVPILHTIQAQREKAILHLAVLIERAGEPARIIDSQPGVDVILTATILAEAGPALESGDEAVLRALCGTAPVTRRSGKSHQVVMRHSCNVRLRTALRNWAQTAIRCEPRTRALYDAMRARGHRHDRALRGIADRLLHRLVACLRTGKRYDPSLWVLPEPLTSP